ncbi:MAG: hypothetical protein NTU80_08445 [Verrucomicrobia bacterium]|nr:hypothetical protein [Verrucomicrobiota bacterium]
MQAKPLTLLCLLLGIASTQTFAQNSATKKSPTSKFYVADVKGFSEVNNGTKIEDLTEKSVLDAEGAVIETKNDSTNAVVMSNGAGIFLAPDTRMAVKRFAQDSFSPNRTDLDSEPSISQTRNVLARGSVGICTGKLVAGSSMVYDTGNTSLNILSQSPQKVAIQANDDETTITLFEGAVTLSSDTIPGGQPLKPGQQALVRSRGVGQPPQITIRPIPPELREGLEDMVNGACQARRKVYFDTVERQNTVEGTTSELTPVTVSPVNPAEVGPIVSPARP